MAPVDTEQQQKFDEQLSSSSAAAGSDDEPVQICPIQKYVLPFEFIDMLIHLSANPPNRFLAASERG